jgi:hypothetical protein
MRRLWSIIALLAVLGGLLGAYSYLTRHPQDENKTESNKEQVEILKLDKSKLNKIIISNDKGNFTLEKKEAKWFVSSKQNIKLDDIALLNIEDSLAALNADKLVEKNPSDIEQFGLKSPKSSVTLFIEDGTSKTILLGNKTVDGGNFYAMIKDGTEVYTIPSSIGEYLNYGLSDIRSRNLTSINTQEINYLKLVNSAGKTIELQRNDQQSSQEKQFQINNYIMTKPYSDNFGVDINKFSELANNIQGLKIVDFVDDSGKELAKYGLDKPSFELQVKDNANELRLYFGKEDGDKVFFKSAGTPEVYSMEKQRLHEIDLNAFDLLNKTVFMPFIETVDDITIEQKDKKDVITLTKESGQTEVNYKINEKVVGKDDFQQFYQLLIGLSSDSENDKSLQNNPEVKIVYTLNTGTDKTKTLSFVVYNQDFYALFMNGKAEFLVAKAKVQNMLGKLDTLK